MQAQSDIEWKYGLAKLIRNMHRTQTTPSPLNLVTSWLVYLIRACKAKSKCRRASTVNPLFARRRAPAKSRVGQPA